MRSIAQPHARESLERFFLVRHAVKILRQHDILDGTEKGNQVKLLEDETDLFGAHAVQLRSRNPGHILPIEPDLARRWPVQAANQIHQRRFPRSRRPHDRQPFPPRHMQGNVVESMN